MKLSHYLKTREGALKENVVSRAVIATLVLSNLVLGLAMTSQKTTIVMVPPTLESSSEIGASDSGKETQVAWGMYLAGMLGNVTPRTAPYLKQNISRHLSPNLYSSIVEAIDQQAAEIASEQITLSFSPTIGRYDAELDRVIVTGELTIRGLRGAEKRELRTYEMKFVTRNYNVMLDALRIMQGKHSKDAATQE